MILALLPPLCGVLLGYGVLRLLRPPWPALVLIAGGALVGPPLLTLLFFLVLEAGSPHGLGLGLALAGISLAVFVIGLRAPGGQALGVRRAAGPVIISLGYLLLTVLRLLDRPCPAGDGLGNFATKARFFYAEGTPWTFLHDPRLAALHRDYPLHAPFSMDLGFLLGGSTEGLFGLAGDALLFPALALFVGLLATRVGILAGILATLLSAAVPAFYNYSAVGYADPPLLGLFTVAGLALCTVRPAWTAAALATGLLAWVKLEGLVLGALVAVVGAGLAWRRRALPWPAILIGLGLGAIWPMTLIRTGLAQAVAEPVAAVDLPTRFAATLNGFGRLLVDPQEALAFLLVPALIACLLGCRRSTTGPAAWLVLLAFVTAPAATIIRNTALAHLQSGVPIRLCMHFLPLAIYVLAVEVARTITAPGRASPVPTSSAAVRASPPASA